MNPEALSRGWQVFPVWWIEGGCCACKDGASCQHPGKHPLYHPQDLPCGRNSATTNPDLMRRWWTRWTKANLGIATGPESGLVVLDIDPRHGGHPDQLPGKLPLTPTVFTGGSGWHFYLAHPGDGITFLTKIPACSGADIKANGGYVVAPPSSHISGKSYTWLTSPWTPLAPIPDWLMRLTRKSENPPSAKIPMRTSYVMESAYGRTALSRELARLAQTPEGNRNNALNRSAFSLGRLVAAGNLVESTVVTLLMVVGHNLGLSARETESTIKSGLRAGVEQGEGVANV